MDHEVFDDPMKAAALEANGESILPTFTRAELTEVLGCPGNDVGEQLHLQPAHVLATDRYVEEHNRIGVFVMVS